MTRAQLRIALIAGEDPGWGGIGTYTGELARGLVAEGHHVELVLRGWERDCVEQLDGLKVHRVTVPPPSWRRGTIALLSRAHAAREAVVFSSRVARVVAGLHRFEGLDLVEAPEFHASGLASTLRSRGAGEGPVVVARLHAPSFLTARLAGEKPTPDSRMLERLERAAVRRATIVTSPSVAMAAEVAARWGADLRRRVHVVPNPIDVDRFAPLETAADPRTLLIVGRIERNKGQDVAVEALPTIRRAVAGSQLLLVGADSELAGGGGSALAALRRRVAELELAPDALQAAGEISRDELPAYFARASVCLVPSRFEAFGYTCLEAMSCGRAVVASAVGGLPEIVNDGHDGCLVPADDPGALSDAVIRLLTDPDLRRRLGTAARASVVQQFAAPVVARAVTALYIDAAAAATISGP